MNLPNRCIHHFYAENYRRSIAAQKNPEGPEAKELEAQAMAAAFTGQI